MTIFLQVLKKLRAEATSFPRKLSMKELTAEWMALPPHPNNPRSPQDFIRELLDLGLRTGNSNKEFLLDADVSQQPLSQAEIAESISATMAAIDDLVAKHFSSQQNKSLGTAQKVSLLMGIVLQHAESQLFAAYELEQARMELQR